MEHDVCKNIPVIMMSSQDSFSMVYKCMLRGAADFLVKPVRKNELKNLWQHFWRKQASNTGGTELPDESVAQQKVEATAENKADSNHSSDSMQCIMRNREYTEKGSDAQSSSTMPGLDFEKTKVKHGHCLPLEIARQFSNDLHVPLQERCHLESRKAKGQGEVSVGNILTGLEQDKASTSNSAKNYVHENPSREAIDLIGTFVNYEKSCGSIPVGGSARSACLKTSDSLPYLDLSLKRSNSTGHVNQINEEHRLNHSDASAFHRYIGKQLHTSPSICAEQKNQGINSDKKYATRAPCHSPVFICQPEQPSETAVPYPCQREKTLPIPVKGTRFENVINTCDFMIRNPVPADHSDATIQMNKLQQLDHPCSSSQQVHNLADQRVYVVNDQSDMKKAQNMDFSDDKANLFSVNNSSANSSFCVGNSPNHPNHDVSALKVMSEDSDEKGLHVYEGSSHGLTQREAALNKFRLKRKDRCFEKKVRYESRKKLAEQRPRVKGQFVRQVPNHHPQSDNSSTG